MTFKVLDTVVVTADLPVHGLKRGDIGAVVQIYSPTTVEIEFVMASGHTQALVMLDIHELRPVGPKDLLAVRQLDAA